MIGEKVIEEEPITYPETLDILEERKKEEELEFEQRLSYDYVQKFSKLSSEDAKKLIEELLEIEKIRKNQAVVLINNMPETAQDIRLIFAKERTSLDDKTIEKILEIIEKYRG